VFITKKVIACADDVVIAMIQKLTKLGLRS